MKKVYTFYKKVIDEITKKSCYAIFDKKYSKECGYTRDASLAEKQEFYSSADKFSKLIKLLILELGSDVYIGRSFTNTVFYEWSDLSEYDAFNNIKSIINEKHDYRIKLPEDSAIVDYIVENNFRYFTQINFCFKDIDLLIVPDCHIQLLCYMDNQDAMEFIKTVLEKFDGLEIVEDI